MTDEAYKKEREEYEWISSKLPKRPIDVYKYQKMVKILRRVREADKSIEWLQQHKTRCEGG